MAIQPVYESVRLNSKKKTAQKQIKIEGKTEIPVEAFSKVLDVSAFIGALDTEVEQGKIKFNGRALFNIVYETEDKSLKKYEYALNFSDEIIDATIIDGCGVEIKSTVEKCGSNSGASIGVYAYVLVVAKTSVCENVNLITGGEDVIVSREELEYLSAYGLKQTTFPMEEEFELNYQVAEVLSHGVSSSITAVQCGVGSIIIDGETTVSALLLQNLDKSDIIKEERTFPFRAEIEYDDAMPSMRALATVKEKSFKSDIVVDEEAGKSNVTYSVTLQFGVEAYSSEKLSVITDAFSLTDKTEIKQAECSFTEPFDVRTGRVKVLSRVPAPEIPAGSKIMAVTGERVEIAEHSQTDKGLKISGVLYLKAYFRDGEGKNFSVNFEAPFSEDIECVLPSGIELDVRASANHGGVRIISFAEVEVVADLTFTVYASLTHVKKYVKEICSLGVKPIDNHAISVYIPEEGEELWSLAKRLNVCPEVLCETNKDLQFPLTGKERILIYRQK